MKKEQLEKQLTEIFTSLKRERVKFSLKEVEHIEDSHLISQMFGNPYFEKEETWPNNSETGEPLEFIFQIINEESTPLPKDIGMIQVFIDPNNIPITEKDPGISIKVYKDISEEKLVKISKPYSEAKPITLLLDPSLTVSLPDNEDRPSNVYEIGRKLENLDSDIDYFEAFDEIYYKLGVDEFDYSGIGGYPHWLQGSEYPCDDDDNELDFLFEIHGGFKWNFMVALLFFINPNNPKDIRFVHQFT